MVFVSAVLRGVLRAQDVTQQEESKSSTQKMFIFCSRPLTVIKKKNLEGLDRRDT